MTSNHPEKLDPALIRPGRIDKILKLGYIKADAVVNMVNHYFAPETLSETQHELINNLFDDEAGAKYDNTTPAQIEQLCAEYDRINDFIESGLLGKGAKLQ